MANIRRPEQADVKYALELEENSPYYLIRVNLENDIIPKGYMGEVGKILRKYVNSKYDSVERMGLGNGKCWCYLVLKNDEM